MDTRNPIITRIKIAAHTHPADFSTVWLCQFAVNGVPCIPFWSHEIQRREQGEENWMRDLESQAVELVQQYGPAPALV